MNKEEIIEKAYMNIFKNIFYTDIQKGIDENGWYSNERNDAWLPIQTEFSQLDLKNNNTEIRPKSLFGIDHNNGYTKIESEKDIPAEEGIFWVLRRGFHKPMYRVINDLFDEEEKAYWLENYTHFIKVNRPENLPIY